MEPCTVCPFWLAGHETMGAPLRGGGSLLPAYKGGGGQVSKCWGGPGGWRHPWFLMGTLSASARQEQALSEPGYQPQSPQDTWVNI